MEAANLNPGEDGISIGIPTNDPNCNAATGQCTITLTRALPNIAEGVAIDGPGANLLKVWRDFADPNEFRIFNITTSGTVSLSRMTISGGVADTGGAIYSSFGGRCWDRCTVGAC